MTLNLASIVTESAARFPHRPAILERGQTIATYAQLNDMSARFAQGLVQRGLRNEVVAVRIPNSVEFVAAYLGTLRSGNIFLPLNPQLKAREIDYHLADSHAQLLITVDGDVEAASVPAEGTSPQRVTFTDFLAGAKAPMRALATTNGDDTAALIYTSGTTGRPKAAELTHMQLLLNCSVGSDIWQLGADDVILATIPFAHVFGISSVLNRAILKGAALAVVPRFSAAAAFEAARDNGVTVMTLVPTMIKALVDHDGDVTDMSTLRLVSSGSAPLAPELMEAFERRFGAPILEGYGLTESASLCCCNPSPDNRKVGSAGRPAWGVEMKLLDSEGRDLPPGSTEIGEIAIRGHNVMKGYRGRPAETAEVLHDGWFRTGDLAVVDADGFYYIKGRLKSVIIRGGYNVYPREIEELLLEHPSISEAAVVGVPDERLGEEVVAVVAGDRGLDTGDVLEFCRDKVASYKRPRVCVIVDALPRVAAGKVDQVAARAIAAAESQRQEDAART